MTTTTTLHRIPLRFCASRNLLTIIPFVSVCTFRLSTATAILRLKTSSEAHVNRTDALLVAPQSLLAATVDRTSR
jgi:hypothetical protein